MFDKLNESLLSVSQEPRGWTVCRRSQTVQDLQHQGHLSVKTFTLHANTLEQWMTCALDAARVGVQGRAGVAAESFQGVIWNFTDILTRVLTPPLRSELRDLSRSRASDLLLC